MPITELDLVQIRTVRSFFVTQWCQRSHSFTRKSCLGMIDLWEISTFMIDVFQRTVENVNPTERTLETSQKELRVTLSSSTLLWKRTGWLTVGLLVAGAGSRSTELLGLAAARISNQQGPVVLDQDVLDLLLGGLIHIYEQNILWVMYRSKVVCVAQDAASWIHYKHSRIKGMEQYHNVCICAEPIPLLTLLIVCNQGFGDGLTDCWKRRSHVRTLINWVNMNNSFRGSLLTVDLCDMSTTLHSDSDVNSRKTLLAQQQHWLQKLNRTKHVRLYLVSNTSVTGHIPLFMQTLHCDI